MFDEMSGQCAPPECYKGSRAILRLYELTNGPNDDGRPCCPYLWQPWQGLPTIQAKRKAEHPAVAVCTRAGDLKFPSALQILGVVVRGCMVRKASFYGHGWAEGSLTWIFSMEYDRGFPVRIGGQFSRTSMGEVRYSVEKGDS